MPDKDLDVIKREETTCKNASNPGWWARLKRWLAGHHLTLMALPDTPHSIALGAAVGMFFGFTPLFGMKTLLSVVGAWLFKGNWKAAVVAVTLHDLLLPVLPAMFFWQYKVGTWASPGRIPESAGVRQVALLDYMEWTTFLTVGRPILVGSLFLALPAAVLVYFGLRGVLMRARKTPEN